MPARFRTSFRVRFNEVDVQGVVHHARIVTYLEIARLEFWRSLQISYRKMREDGYEFLIHSISVRYLKPLLFDEIIEIAIDVKEISRASLVLGYHITKEDGNPAVTAETKLVCSPVEIKKSTAIPQEYRKKLLLGRR